MGATGRISRVRLDVARRNDAADPNRARRNVLGFFSRPRCETAKPHRPAFTSRQRASKKVASVTHLAAWRAARAAVATWRAPIEVCVMRRWMGYEHARGLQMWKTRRDEGARDVSIHPKKLIRTLRGARYFRRSACATGTNLGCGSVRRGERAE